MGSKISLSFFLIFSSFVFLGFSQNVDELTKTFGPSLSILNELHNESGNGGAGPAMECIQKLLPCQPYLQGTVKPPPTCCVPLTDMIVHQTHCVCSVMTDPALMKSFNVTVEDGLNLAKTCGTSVDGSLCEKGTPPSGSPANPPPVDATAPPTGSKKNTANHGITHFGGSGFFAAIFMGLIVSIFLGLI